MNIALMIQCYFALKYCARISRANIARPEKRASGKKPRRGCSGHKTGILAASPRQNAHSVNSGGGDFRDPGTCGFIPQIFPPAPDFFVRAGNRFFCLPRKRLRALDSDFGAPPLKLALMFWRAPKSLDPPKEQLFAPIAIAGPSFSAYGILGKPPNEAWPGGPKGGNASL